MHRIIKFLLIGTLTGFASCQISSKAAMDGSGGRTTYNIALQATNAEQMLLNLVRLRYADIPFFLDVSSITTQTTFRTEVNPTVPIPGFTQENPASVGAGIMWQDQPTITYTPLEGQSFAMRMLRPVDLQTIQLLAYSGWDIDRIFRMLIQNFEGVMSAPEATDKEKLMQYVRFLEFSELLRHFQRKGELQLGVNVKKSGVEQPTAEESLQIAFPEQGAESERLAEILSSCNRTDGRCRKEVEFGFNQKGRLGLMTRSILSCMYYLSHGVEVPEAHIEEGLVKKPTCPGLEEQEEWQKMFCSLLKIHWSCTEPKGAYLAVKYHDTWFYIEDRDRSSKKTFCLLMQLYNLNAIVPNNRGPILTLPLR